MQLPITQESPWWIILMGIEHERIHIETSSVLHRQMPLEFIQSVEGFDSCQAFPSAPQNALIEIEGQTIILGKHPPFWVPTENGAFKLRLLDKEIELPLAWAVEVNALEAMAFCRWKSQKEGQNYGLPSEAEWYVLYEKSKRGKHEKRRKYI